MNNSENSMGGPDGCSDSKVDSRAVNGNQGLELLVFSDFICPWCLIGKKRLADALALVPQTKISVRWMPFELNPLMPPEGMDRRSYRSKKFGSWERSQVLDAQVERAGRYEGLVFRHDLMERTPNTRNAHRLSWLALQQGKQDCIAESILRGYFLQGRDIGVVEVLADIAAEHGMDREETRRWLNSKAGSEKVEQQLDQSRRLGVTGVPSVFVDGTFLFSGAQEPQVIANKLNVDDRRQLDE